MPQIFGNNGSSTLSAGISASDTTIFIQPGQGGRFPVVAGANFAFCALEDASGNVEIVRVTAHAANATSFTVTRAQQGTTARAYAIGDLLELRPTALEAAAWEADIDDLELTRSRHAGQAYTGAHDFSAASAVTLPAATSIGTVSAAEILTLDGIGSNIQAQLNSKVNKAGDTYTGAHDLSGASSVSLPANTSIGGVSAAEIAALDSITGNVQGQIDSLETRKADTNGETYSGTHDFTAAVLRAATKATGTNTDDVATMAALQQAVFASFANLPADPGDAVPRALQTFNGVKSWSPLGNDQANFAAGII